MLAASRICQMACSCARCPTWTQAESCVPRPSLCTNTLFCERVSTFACPCARTCRGESRCMQPRAGVCFDACLPASSSGHVRTCARPFSCRCAARRPPNLVLQPCLGSALELGVVSCLSLGFHFTREAGFRPRPRSVSVPMLRQRASRYQQCSKLPRSFVSRRRSWEFRLKPKRIAWLRGRNVLSEILALLSAPVRRQARVAQRPAPDRRSD